MEATFGRHWVSAILPVVVLSAGVLHPSAARAITSVFFDISQTTNLVASGTTLDAFRHMPAGLPRLSVEGGLAAVVATQVWHHLYIDANLAELPEKVSAAS